MKAIRAEIASIVERHIEEILDDTMRAYAAEIPRLAGANAADLARARASTRRATLSFLALYADPGSPAHLLLDDARRATTDRAGEIFDRDEIVAMVRVARQVIVQRARGYVAAELGPEDVARRQRDVEEALNAFLAELERTEQVAPEIDDALHHLLAQAEKEGPDVS